MIKPREFNNLTLDAEHGIITKTSKNKEKLINEISWYLKLPKELDFLKPRIFEYSLESKNPYISMEYYSYVTIHDLMIYKNLDNEQWIKVFNTIKFVYNKLIQYKIKDNKIRESLQEMYLNKTINRLDAMKNNDMFKDYYTHSIIVNSKEYKPLNEVCEILKNKIPSLLFNIDCFNIIHGDLCFTNILIDPNFDFCRLIDPRGNFGLFDIYGDFRYELAKLFHSIDGEYDYIIRDLFTLKIENSKISYRIKETQQNNKLYKLFLEVFSNEIQDRKKEIELIEALLFLSMLPLHSDNIKHQYVMLAKGLEILDRVVDIKA